MLVARKRVYHRSKADRDSGKGRVGQPGQVRVKDKGSWTARGYASDHRQASGYHLENGMCDVESTLTQDSSKESFKFLDCIRNSLITERLSLFSMQQCTCTRAIFALPH